MLECLFVYVFQQNFNIEPQCHKVIFPSELLLRKIETYFEEVQARAAQHADDMNERLTAYFDAVRQNAEDKLNTLKDLLNDQAEKAMEKWENIKEQAEEVKMNLFTPFQKKMEEVKNWFQKFLNYWGATDHKALTTLRTNRLEMWKGK